MNNDITNMTNDKKSIAYGAKLKVAREAMGLEQKDVAAQLRLAERIIIMLESGHYAEDVPTTFVRGYLRSYSKLLQIPESDIAAALEPIKPTPAPQENSLALKQPADLTSSNYYMQFSTYAIVATLAGMLGLWWYNHTPASSSVTPSQTLAINDLQNTQPAQPATATTVKIPLATTVRIPLAPVGNTAAPVGSTMIASASTTSPNGTITATPSENKASAPAATTKPSAATKRVTRDDDDDDDDDDERDND